MNSVLPGWTITERVDEILTSRAQKNHTDVGAEQTAVIKSIPLGRLGKPDELASVVVFLASERASFVTGVALLVDGGETRTPF